MKLLKVEIVNFRSIKNTTLILDPACRVLVGINESGKSNILKALAFLKPERTPVRKDDVREGLPDEEEIKQAHIRFYIGLEKPEVDLACQRIEKKIACKNIDSPIALLNKQPATLSKLCNEYSEARYFVDLLEEKAVYRYQKFDDNVELSGTWKKPKEGVPPEFTFILSDSDAPAKEQRKQYRLEKGFGEWKVYQDVDSTLTAVTGEDFLKNAVIVSQVTAVAVQLGLPEFPAGACPDHNKVHAIETWLKANGLNSEQSKDAIFAIKNALFEKLAAKDIEDVYASYLDGVAAAIS